MKTPCSRTPTLMDTDAASCGQATTAPTTAPIPTTTGDGDSGTEPASATGPGTLSSEPTTGGCPPDALECAGACDDGSAEVLFVSNFAPQYGTLTVLGHADSTWMPSARRGTTATSRYRHH